MRKTLTLFFALILSSSAWAQYCTPGYLGGGALDFIDGVELNTISNLNNGYTGVDYVDYTGTFQTDLFPGTSYTVFVTGNPNFTEDVAVWIDFDGNSTFDPTELIGQQPVAAATQTPFAFTVPGAAVTGLTRMRVMSVFSAGGPIDPCSTTNFFGEAEDYGINILPPANDDGGVSNVLYPQSGCGLSNTELIEVEISNYGTSNQTSFTVGYIIDNGAPVLETFTGTLNGGASTTYTFTTPADFSATATYNVQVFTVIANDGNAANDTFTYSLNNTFGFNTFPYYEDFENGNGGWTALGGASSWQLATPAPPGITGAASGVNAWVTNPTGTYNTNENSFVRSPCFDMSALIAPIIEMDIWWESEFSWDGAVLQSSVNGGTSWQNVGAFGDPNNWYNDNSLNGNPGGQQEGWTGRGTTGSGGWVTAKHDLTGLGGQNDVRFRVAFGSDGSVQDDGFAFDNVFIYESPDNDISVTALTSPQEACGLTATETVSFSVDNLGTNVITAFDATYIINGGTPVTESFTGNVAPGASGTFSFTTTADFTAGGNYSVVIYATLANDAIPQNDTLNTSLFNPLVTGYPYFEDFESGALPQGWTQQQNDNTQGQDWLFDQGGTPSFGTGPAVDHTLGTAQGWYAYVEDSGFDNDTVGLITPCFDIAGMNSPEFSFWYHSNDANAGANSNFLHIDVFANGAYTLDIIPPTGHKNNNWNQVVLNLGFFQSAGIISVRFRVDCNNGNFSHDIALDDINLTDLIPQDAGVKAIPSPASSCGLGLEDVVAEIENFGTAPITGFDVTYVLDNGTPVTETITGVNILPGATYTHTFGTQVDLTVFGTYSLQVYTDLNGDTNFGNDSLTVSIENIPVVDNFPYFEDFENGNAGWVSGGNGSDWQLATPNNATINSAFSGVNSWITNPNGNYSNNQDSYVEGPCFDFTNLTIPVVEMGVWWESEFSWDGAVLQSSIDNGASWQNVGAYLDPNNWYNDNTINGNPGGQQEGWTGRTNTNNGSGAWVVAKNQMTGLGGQPAVKLRVAFGSDGSVQDDGFAFDDIFIYDLPGDDVGVIEFLAPGGSNCGDTAQDVIVLIENFGSDPQFNFPVAVDSNGVQVLLTTYTDTLDPGEVDTVILGTFNTTLGGIFNMDGYTLLQGDTTNFNDTTAFLVEVTPIPADPIVIGDLNCEPDSFTLIATGSIGNYKWYDVPVGGVAIASSDTFVTPFLTQTTTYYVEASDQQSFTFGAPNNSIGGGGNYTFFGDGLVFDVFADMILDSLTLYPSGNGTIQINLEDAAGNVIDFVQIPHTGGAGPVTVPVGFEIPPGTGYEINLENSTVPSFFRNTSGAAYPYTLPGIASITSAINNLNGFYYFFYNWQVSTFGCTSNRVPITAVVSPPPVVNLGPDAVVCEGFLLDGSNQAAGSYLWEPVNLTAAAIPMDSSALYVLTVTDTLGCVGQDSIDVTVQPTPTVDIGNDTTVCGVLTLDAGNPNASFVWNTQEFTQSINVTSSGTYAVSVTNAFGCEVTDTIEATVNPLPNVNLGGNVQACDSAVLNAGNLGSSFAWSTGEQTQQIVTEMTGEYSVTITTPAGCSNADTIDVTINPSPIVDLGPNQATCDQITLDAGNAGSTYFWSTGANTQTITVGAGTYTVTVTSPNGCTGSDIIFLSSTPAPVVDLGNDRTVCDSAMLDAGNTGATYLWSTGETSQNITVNQTGLYVVQVTTAPGCTETESVNITVSESPTADFTYNYINNNTVEFNSNPSGTPPYTYQWDFGDGLTSTQANPNHTYAAVGNYTVTLIVSNSCGTSEPLVEILQSVSITDELFAQSIQIYPNPNEGVFQVVASELDAESLTLEVTDLAGKLIYTYDEQNVVNEFDHQIDISDFSRGVYFVSLTDGERMARFKVVVR